MLSGCSFVSVPYFRALRARRALDDSFLPMCIFLFFLFLIHSFVLTTLKHAPIFEQCGGVNDNREHVLSPFPPAVGIPASRPSS